MIHVKNRFQPPGHQSWGSLWGLDSQSPCGRPNLRQEVSCCTSGGGGLVQRTAIAVDSVIKSDQNEKSGHEGSYCIFTALVLAYVWGTITPSAGDKGANHRLRASRDTLLALEGAHDHVLCQMWKGEQRRRRFLRPMRCESGSDAPATGTGEAVKYQEDSSDSWCRLPHSCPSHHDIDSRSCVGAQLE